MPLTQQAQEPWWTNERIIERAKYYREISGIDAWNTLFLASKEMRDQYEVERLRLTALVAEVQREMAELMASAIEVDCPACYGRGTTGMPYLEDGHKAWDSCEACDGLRKIMVIKIGTGELAGDDD